MGEWAVGAKASASSGRPCARRRHRRAHRRGWRACAPPSPDTTLAHPTMPCRCHQRRYCGVAVNSRPILLPPSCPDPGAALPIRATRRHRTLAPVIKTAFLCAAAESHFSPHFPRLRAPPGGGKEVTVAIAAAPDRCVAAGATVCLAAAPVSCARRLVHSGAQICTNVIPRAHP
jgi:hypothetical protein